LFSLPGQSDTFVSHVVIAKRLYDKLCMQPFTDAEITRITSWLEGEDGSCNAWTPQNSMDIVICKGEKLLTPPPSGVVSWPEPTGVCCLKRAEPENIRF